MTIQRPLSRTDRDTLRRILVTFERAGANYSTVPGLRYLAATTPDVIERLLDEIDSYEDGNHDD